MDNAPYSYMMQLGNGVPILPYYRGKEDDQLYGLEEYLMGMKDVDDVRKVNGPYFKLYEYSKFDSFERLVNKLYPEWIKWAKGDTIYYFSLIYQSLKPLE